MDSNANAGSPEPVNPHPGGPPRDNPAGAGGEGERPDHAAEVNQLKAWLRENRVSLIVTAVVVALVCIYLDVWDTVKVVVGLGLVIFIHELGHFLAAKWCDVHVRTFSIGFGPAVPFCSYKWGETTYMIGIIPLGGYVMMVGEGEAAGDEEAEDDPRSFKRKSVGQRMLIISAGVVMNILLGMACFVAAYMHGVKEKPATVGTIESGGAAWQVGMRTDDHITEISGRPDPYFNDLRPYVMSTRKGEAVEVEVRHPDGSTQEYKVEPLREEGARFPQLGIAPPYRLTLLTFKKGGVRPTVPGSPADEAKDPGFEAGDRVIATTDPDPTKGVTPLPPDPLNPGGDPDVSEFYRRMAMLAGKPVTIRVQRKDRSETADVVVQPAYRADLGVRMRMGKIVALRKDGPAAKAGVQAWSEEQPTQGDRIKTVKLPEPGDKQTWFAAGDVRASGQSLWPGRFPLLLLPDGTLAIPVADGTLVTLPGGQRVTVRQLDPVELPLELKMWADRAGAAKKPNFTVGLEVLRPQGHQENTPVSLSLTYDPKYRYDQEGITLPNSPVPLGGLGLAYWVEAVVDEVDKGGPADGKLQREDIVTAVRFKTAVPGGETKAGDWNEVKPNQWASVDAALQSQPRGVVDLKVKRGDEEVVVEDLKPRPDTRHPTDDRGLVLQYDFRVQTAADVGDAVRLGYLRTARSIKEVYMGLYAMAFGRVSAKTMSGPLTIGNVAYRFAGEDFWQFLLFLGLISVNLAVVNFLPIPVLDGGHMVFLTLEWVLGRPVPERIFGAAMWIGVILILSLMVFVFVLDIRRLFFGWF